MERGKWEYFGGTRRHHVLVCEEVEDERERRAGRRQFHSVDLQKLPVIWNARNHLEIELALQLSNHLAHRRRLPRARHPRDVQW